MNNYLTLIVDYVLRFLGEDDDQRKPVEKGVEFLSGCVVLRLSR
jgi:hypothetical protein